MQKITYYDEIKGEEVELNVTNEVAKGLKKLNSDQSNVERKFRKNECFAEDIDGSENYFIDVSDNPLEALVKKEKGKYQKQARRKQLLKKAIKTLTEKERLLIKKVFYENYTQAELARELGLARSTIKNRYDSALSKIKEYILNNE